MEDTGDEGERKAEENSCGENINFCATEKRFICILEDFVFFKCNTGRRLHKRDSRKKEMNSPLHQ